MSKFVGSSLCVYADSFKVVEGPYCFCTVCVFDQIFCIYIAPDKREFNVNAASVAQLDAHPTGDQEVAGLTPSGSATFFRGDLIMKYFLWSFSPFR